MNAYFDLLKHYASMSVSDPKFPLHLVAGSSSEAAVTSSGLWTYYEEEKTSILGVEHYFKRLYVKKISSIANHRHDSFTQETDSSDGPSYGGWVVSEEMPMCMVCSTAFTSGVFGRSKHHCRGCGNVVCGLCSPDREFIDQFEGLSRQRVCLQCYWGQSPVYPIKRVPKYLRTPSYSPSQTAIESKLEISPPQNVYNSSPTSSSWKSRRKVPNVVSYQEFNKSRDGFGLTNEDYMGVGPQSYTDDSRNLYGDLGKYPESSFDGQLEDLRIPSVSEEDVNIWGKFLAAGEAIIASSTVMKKNRFGIMQSRQLLLTDAPAMIYADPKTKEFKGEIPWDVRNPPIVMLIDSCEFEVLVEGRVYKFTDNNRGAKFWADHVHMAKKISALDAF